MEYIAKEIKAYSKNNIGCKRHNRDVMISFYDGESVHDVFLTQQQADELRKLLKDRMFTNRKNEKMEAIKAGR